MFAVQYFHSKNKRASFFNLLPKGYSSQQSKKIFSFMQSYAKPDHSRIENNCSIDRELQNSYISLLELNDPNNYVDDSVPVERTKSLVSSDETCYKVDAAGDSMLPIEA